MPRRAWTLIPLPIAVVMVGLIVGLILGRSHQAHADVSVAFTYVDGDSGGAAVVRIDPTSGRILDVSRLFESSTCKQPLKIRRTADHRTVVVTNLVEDGPHLFVWSADRPDRAKGLQLISIADEVRIAGDQALVTLEDDATAAIDLSTRKVASLRRLDKLLTPPANKPEDLTVDPTGQFAVVSFQKDSSKGKKKGNRLVVFGLPEFNVVADLPLPRSRPDLHIRGDLKQQGPGPEVLHISPETDTLSVTLDLYGGLGIVAWSQAKAGRVDDADWTMISTGKSTELTGRSFPDRAAPIQLRGRHYYLICNAGVDGGSVLVDLHRRAVVWRRPTPPGLEAPIFIPALSQAFSVCSGKTKRREDGAVVKTRQPQQSLYVFDFHSSDAVRDAPVSAVPLDGLTTQIALASIDPPMLLVASGKEAGKANVLSTFDPISRTVRDRRPVAGFIGRFER